MNVQRQKNGRAMGVDACLQALNGDACLQALNGVMASINEQQWK